MTATMELERTLGVWCNCKTAPKLCDLHNPRLLAGLIQERLDVVEGDDSAAIDRIFANDLTSQVLDRIPVAELADFLADRATKIKLEQIIRLLDAALRRRKAKP